MGIDEKKLTKRERRLLKKQQLHNEQQGLNRKRVMKRVGFSVLGLVGIIVIILILNNISFETQILPPTSMQGHIEQNPSSHILDEPMLLTVHKHMLEHADGTGPPGVIISYNCEDFNCESDFIDRLKVIAEQYPENVYLAPFKNMSAKLVLTKLGKREILDEIDEQVIRDFIGD